MNYNALSLFSSAGVAETYFEKHGIQVKVAAELLPERASFYQHLYPKTKMMQGDITDDTFFKSVLSAAKKEKCDFLIATPPCQGMSTAGKQKKDDPRNRLIIYVVQAIKALNPKFVIIENVPEILLTKIEIDGKWIKIDEYLKKNLGTNYTFNINNVVNAMNYGVAQSRERCVYLLSRMDTNIHWEFPAPLNHITTMRDDYKQITDEWEITNIVNDCKIINIFTDENIRLLSSQRNEENGKLYYSLSKTLDNAHREQIRTISVTYKPLRLFAYTNGNIKTVHQWVDAVLGRVSDNSLVFRYDENSDKEFCFDYSKSGRLVPGVFEQALLKAFNDEKKNVYIVLDGITEAVLAQKLSGLWPLLKPKDDFLEEDHGWSINPIENKRLYDGCVFLIKFHRMTYTVCLLTGHER